MRPHIRENESEVSELLCSLVGERLSRVTYVYPDAWSITDEAESDHVHEAGMDVVLHFIGGGHLKVSWAMAGLVEGLEISRNDVPRHGLMHVDVSASPSWARLLGHELNEPTVLWRAANEDASESIWWTGFTLNSGNSFSITLGEMDDGIPDYKPNSLLVFFNEVQDHEFRKRTGRYWD